MRFLCLSELTPTATPAAIRDGTAAEARAAWELYHRGVVRDWAMRGDRPGAMLLLECASAEEANAALAELPMVRDDLIRFQVIPLTPFAPLEALFAPPASA